MKRHADVSGESERPRKRARRCADVQPEYKDFDSEDKAVVTSEFAAWAAFDQSDDVKRHVLLLDGSEMRGCQQLQLAGVAAEGVTVVERDPCAFRLQKVVLTHREYGCNLEYGDVFAFLRDAAVKFDAVFLDLTCGNVSDAELQGMQQWESQFKEDEYHCLFLTLATRSPDGSCVDYREHRIVKALTRGTFGHHMTWGYKRDAASQSMMVLMFATDAPEKPVYRPHRICEVDKTGSQPRYLVKFFGSTQKCWLGADDDAVKQLLMASQRLE